MSVHREAIQTAFGGPELISLVEAPVPSPGPGEVRVKVAAAGLNPVDWKLAAYPALAEMFGVTIPGGYGSDFSGIVDALGPDVTGFAVGDAVFGGARGHAVADYTVVPTSALLPVPEGLSLDDAATLPIAGATAAAALAPLALGPQDTVLIGGAAGGVGVLAVQLAAATGATVVATGSPANHDFLAGLGALPVAYGDGLADRVRGLTDRPVTAAVDLQGTATVEAALALGVAPERITAIAAGGDLPAGVISTGGAAAAPGASRTSPPGSPPANCAWRSPDAIRSTNSPLPSRGSPRGTCAASSSSSPESPPCRAPRIGVRCGSPRPQRAGQRLQ